MQPNHLIGLVQNFLAEEPPTPIKFPAVDAAGHTPIEQAVAGLCAAVNAVSEADHVVQLADWEKRQQTSRKWLEHLEAHPIPDSATASAEIESGAMDVQTALFGTNRRWHDALTEIEEMTAWAAERHTESARKMTALGDVGSRVIGIRRRGDERVQQILHSSERKIRKLDPGNDAEREQIFEAARQEVIAVSAVAVRRTNALTRKVLDLDENTAGISVQEWLDRHGLDTCEK